MLFGDRIKQLRNSAGMTQAELGNLIGVSDRVLGYYETNERFPRKQEVISKFAEVFEVSVDYLLGTDGSFMQDDGGFTAKCTIKVNPKPTIKSSTPSTTLSVKTNSNMLFKKQAGYMTVTVYEHAGWVAPIGNSTDIEIFIENSRLCIKFNDKGMNFQGKVSWGITHIYGIGTGVTIKLDSTGEILYERKRTAQ